MLDGNEHVSPYSPCPCLVRIAGFQLGLLFLPLFAGITVVRFLENRNSMVTETSASIILIAFTFGLSIFALV